MLKYRSSKGNHMPSPAFNLESEQAVLGSVLLSPDCIEKAASIVTPEDFSRENCAIFRRMLELFQEGKLIDVAILIDLIKSHGELEAVGGREAIFRLTEGIPKGLNIVAYAEMVRQAADGRTARKSIKKALEGISNNGENPDQKIQQLIEELQHIPRIAPKPGENKFESITEDRFRLTVPACGLKIEVDRLRREHHELIGELCVRSTLPGARTVAGVLSIADFNLSSARARSDRAKLLGSRANVNGIDWLGILEELCQQVLAAERHGQPAVDLRTIPMPLADDSLFVEGMRLPRRHPTIAFGDGGAAKSYTALYLAGCLSRQGFRVALFDWELAGEDHRLRLNLLFQNDEPYICYARCERPLIYESDRLRRVVIEERIDYAIFDSIVFACDGPPESAEVAGRYFRAVRQIGIGSMHIAHVTKGENGDQKPFGSAFWHNGARSTWYFKASEESGSVLNLGMFNRKVNLGGLAQPLGFQISFDNGRTVFSRSSPGETPELADKMTIRQRMTTLLKYGAMSPEAIATEADSDLESVRRTVRRWKNVFTVIEGGKIGLAKQDMDSGQSDKKLSGQS